MNLEEELKLALQRKEPHPGFRERVLAATRRPRHAYRNIAAAALLTLLLGGTTAHFIEERREGERAKEQVLLALRITSHKLHDTREHILEISK
jgi:hypothetical protein